MMQDIVQAEHFRQMALKCSQLAGSTDDPRAIESLRRLAEEYEQAAQAAETAEMMSVPKRANARGPAAEG